MVQFKREREKEKKKKKKTENTELWQNRTDDLLDRAVFQKTVEKPKPKQLQKPKPKQLLRPITAGAGSAINQSQFLAITCNSLEARERSRVHGAIGFGLASYWLKNWRESFKPITKRSNRNHGIAFDSHLKTTLRARWTRCLDHSRPRKLVPRVSLGDPGNEVPRQRCLSWRDNISRCIYLHQVLDVNIRFQFSRFAYESRFTYTYQDPLASPSSLINIDQLHGGSTIKYYNDIRVPTSRFAFIHHDLHIYIKIYTLRITSWIGIFIPSLQTSFQTIIKLAMPTFFLTYMLFFCYFLWIWL